MTDADTFPLTVSEFAELRHLLHVASGGLVDLHAPPSFLASQPVHRRPLAWTWQIQQLFNKAANEAILSEQSFDKMPALPPGVLHSAEQLAAFRARAAERQERAAAELLARLAAHEDEYRAKLAATEPQA